MTATTPANEKMAEAYPKPDKIFGVRHLEAFMMFLGLLSAYCMRINMSVGIVAMTDPTASGPDIPTFAWPKQTQDTILSSFFWGYIVTQVPAGMLTERIGGKFILAFAVFVNSIISLLVPLAATTGGWKAVCGCRVAQGLSQACVYPALYGLLANWAPISERSRMATYVYAGAQLGTVIELILAGFLGGSVYGWPSIFYCSGIQGIVWTVAWLFLGANKPREHKWIAEEELKYIESTTFLAKDKKLPPWKAIFTSVPFYALLATHCGQNWGFWTLLTEIPSYMKSVLGVDIKSNGVLSALPYLTMYLLSFVFSNLSDYIINTNIVTRTRARKINNTISQWGPAIFLIALSYSPSGNLTVAVALLCFTVGLNGSHYVGFGCNHLDLSPNYAATLVGITNMFSNILSVIAPLSVGLIITDETQASEWRIVFFIASAIYFTGNSIFLIFGSAEIQPWNNLGQNSGDIHEIENAQEDKEEKGQEVKTDTKEN